MAGTKISDLTVSSANMQATDLFEVAVDAGGGSFNSRGVEASSIVNKILLTTIDLTNGGANDQNRFDFDTQSDWDNYSYISLKLIAGLTTSTGQMGIGVRTKGSNLSFKGLTSGGKDLWLFNGENVGDQLVFFEVWLSNMIGTGIYNQIGYSTPIQISYGESQGAGHGSEHLGSAGDFDPGTDAISNVAAITNYGLWSLNDAGGAGISKVDLTFVHETGNFNNGTLEVWGII